jgi:hypothetical protein
MNLRKKTVIFSYAMVNLGILKISFNWFFLIYQAIQTSAPVLLVDSPYKSCIATPPHPFFFKRNIYEIVNVG